jgi:hypothetical protein
MSEAVPPAPGFKIAFRSEGAFVVAYFAARRMYDGSMDPIEIARIRRAALDQVDGLFDEFQAVVRKVVSQMCVDLGMPRPTWTTLRAPADERTGET